MGYRVGTDISLWLTCATFLPERSTVLRRSVSHYGKDGGQHTQEQHEKQHGQVEIV